MGNKLIILIVCLILFPLVSAADYEPHKQRTDFTLTITSNNATACNLSSITYPSNTQIIYNKALTKDGKTFYTTIDKSNYSSIGDTCHLISCTDGSQFRTGSECISVTPSGFQGTLGFYVLIWILSVGVIFLGYYSEDAWVVILGSFGLILVGLYIMFYGIDGMKDATYTWGLGIINLMLGAYFGVRGSLEKMELGF